LTLNNFLIEYEQPIKNRCYFYILLFNKLKRYNPKENMAKYEFMLIVDPSVSDDDRTKTFDNIKALLKKNSAKIVKEDMW